MDLLNNRIPKPLMAMVVAPLALDLQPQSLPTSTQIHMTQIRLGPKTQAYDMSKDNPKTRLPSLVQTTTARLRHHTNSILETRKVLIIDVGVAARVRRVLVPE